ncbi:alpha/beta hydrolase [bacterium]|nr:alpha/beta hydrolase [candidate division CSSED10-310 bacterium]
MRHAAFRFLLVGLLSVSALLSSGHAQQMFTGRYYYQATLGDDVVGQEILTFSMESRSQLIINSLGRFPYGLLPRYIETQLFLDGQTLSLNEFMQSEQYGDVMLERRLYRWTMQWWWVETSPPFLPGYSSDIDLERMDAVIDPACVGTVQILVNLYDFELGGEQVRNCLWGGDIVEVTLTQQNAPKGMLRLRVDGPDPMQLDLDTVTKMVVTVRMENSKLTINLVPQLNPLEIRTDDIAAKYDLRHSRVEFTSDKTIITGDLYLPKGEGPYPTIMLIGEGAYGGRMGGLFESIAIELVKRSKVAVLTINQRGIAGSQGTYGEFTIDELANDMEQGINFLKQTREIDTSRLVAGGYGLGGYVAMAVAARNPLLRGCLLMATPAEPYLPDLAVLRMKELAQEESWSEEKLVASIQQVRELAASISEVPGSWTSIAGRPYSLHFSRSCIEFKPLQYLRSIMMPVLIVHGTFDRVVPKGQAEILAKTLSESGNKNVQLELVPRLDHWLGSEIPIEDSYPNASSIHADYKVVRILTGWLDSYVKN